jgi:hypothetical protein
MMLTREAILGAQDLKTVDVEVPEWGGTVRVRVMTAADRNAFGASIVMEDGKTDHAQYAVKMLVRCLVGEDGQPLFTTADLEALNQKSALALKRVFDAADALNALGETQVKEAEKN